MIGCGFTEANQTDNRIWAKSGSEYRGGITSIGWGTSTLRVCPAPECWLIIRITSTPWNLTIPSISSRHERVCRHGGIPRRPTSCLQSKEAVSDPHEKAQQRWDLNIERLTAFLTLLPGNRRCAFEFRNPAWNTSLTYDWLSQHNMAYCIFHLAGFLSPLEVTADFAYIRLHGPGGKYQGSYSDAALEEWAQATPRRTLSG
jgi:Protein of unknown function DUF72